MGELPRGMQKHEYTRKFFRSGRAVPDETGSFWSFVRVFSFLRLKFLTGGSALRVLLIAKVVDV